MSSYLNRCLITAMVLSLFGGCSDSRQSEDNENAIANKDKVSRETSPSKETIAHQKYSAEEFFETISVFGSSISHDSSAILVTSDESSVFNIYRYPMDGGKPTQLTNSTTDTIFGVSWFPKDDRVLYTADQGGNELNHLFVRELDGSVKDLTPGEKLKARFAGWLEDESGFLVLSNERDPKGFDLYRYAIADYSRTLVFQNSDNASIGEVSPNGRWLTISQNVSNADNNIFLVDLNSKDQQQKLITEHLGNISHESYSFTSDSENLIYATNEFGEFSQAWRFNLETGKRMFFIKQTGMSLLLISPMMENTESLVSIVMDKPKLTLPRLPPVKILLYHRYLQAICAV